jgi:DNA-binding MarR family transcriptional regulator
MSAPDASSLYHLHHLLWEVHAAISPVTEDAFEDSELNLPLSGTIDLIGLSPGVTVAELARVQPKTPQAISQLVARLEKMGLIERRLGTGRGVGLYLTASGEEAREDSAAREARIETRLRDMLGTEMYEELQTLLGRARPLLKDTNTTQFVKASDPA